MRVVFYGNQVAGMVALLTVMAERHTVLEVWQDKGYGLPGPFPCVKALTDGIKPPEADALLCVHGRLVVSDRVLDQFPRGGVNLHPFLDQFPGADPVSRAVEAGVTEASVWAHRMTGEVDKGEVLAVARAPMPENPTVERVYNVLYPLYAEVALEALERC